MEALRETIHLSDNHLYLDIDVPESFAGKDVEIIVFPVEEVSDKLVKKGASQGKRVFGACKGQIWMSDDFDDELADEFWLGKE